MITLYSDSIAKASATLYQGYILNDGSFSTNDSWHNLYVRTDFIDITNCNSVTINISTSDIAISYFAIYDANKKFIRYDDVSNRKFKCYTYNKEDNACYVVFDMGKTDETSVKPSDVSADVSISELLQGYLIETGGFSTYNYDKTYHRRWVRTDYIDIRDKDEVTIDVLSSNDIFIYSYQLLDTNKKFKKFVNIDDLKSFTYQKESGIGYIAFDFYKDISTDIFPSELEIDIKFSPYDEVVELKNIKIGTSLIQRIYLGNVEASKVYLGNTLVFDVNS